MALPMDFEARMDQLRERNEALAQSLELTGAMQQANEREIERVAATVDKLAQKIEVLSDRTAQAMEAITRLSNIVEAHESRISDLEDEQ
jgi:methyl-accepting chemotaxis protein